MLFQIPMAVATSSSEASTEAKIASHIETFSKFHHITTGSHPDIKEGKPAPDIFLICANLFDQKVDPSSCLVFEDAPSGVQAARAAGMQVVAIPDKRVNPDIMADATQILYSMAQFRPEEFGLPPFEEWHFKLTNDNPNGELWHKLVCVCAYMAFQDCPEWTPKFPQKLSSLKGIKTWEQQLEWNNPKYLLSLSSLKPYCTDFWK